MTLIERLLAQANKEANELADLLTEAAQALARPAVPDFIPVAQRKLKRLPDDPVPTQAKKVEESSHE